MSKKNWEAEERKRAAKEAARDSKERQKLSQIQVGKGNRIAVALVFIAAAIGLVPMAQGLSDNQEKKTNSESRLEINKSDDNKIIDTYKEESDSRMKQVKEQMNFRNSKLEPQGIFVEAGEYVYNITDRIMIEEKDNGDKIVYGCYRRLKDLANGDVSPNGLGFIAEKIITSDGKVESYMNEITKKTIQDEGLSTFTAFERKDDYDITIPGGTECYDLEGGKAAYLDENNNWVIAWVSEGDYQKEKGFLERLFGTQDNHSQDESQERKSSWSFWFGGTKRVGQSTLEKGVEIASEVLNKGKQESTQSAIATLPNGDEIIVLPKGKNASSYRMQMRVGNHIENKDGETIDADVVKRLPNRGIGQEI